MLSFKQQVHILSGQKTYDLPQSKNALKESVFKPPQCKGSLAIEAALVLPIFLFSVMTLLSLLSQLRFTVFTQDRLYQEGLAESIKAYDTWDEERFPDREFVELNERYEGKLPFDPFHLFQKEFCQSVLFHSWIGYVHGLDGYGAADGEAVVYITENGEVYHRKRDCTHIRLTITEVNGTELAGLRNAYGEKYKACKHCHALLTGGALFVTTDGDCYHSTLSCSGLRRTVRTIPISDIGNRRPCLRCGY